MKKNKTKLLIVCLCVLILAGIMAGALYLYLSSQALVTLKVTYGECVENCGRSYTVYKNGWVIGSQRLKLDGQKMDGLRSDLESINFSKCEKYPIIADVFYEADIKGRETVKPPACQKEISKIINHYILGKD